MFSFTRDLAYILYSVVNVLPVLSNLSVFDLPIDSGKLPRTLSPEIFLSGGDEGTRTPGLCLAKAPLSQLSYIPSSITVGLSGLEPETSPLSEARSNQLS